MTPCWGPRLATATVFPARSGAERKDAERDFASSYASMRPADSARCASPTMLSPNATDVFGRHSLSSYTVTAAPPPLFATSMMNHASVAAVPVVDRPR